MAIVEAATAAVTTNPAYTLGGATMFLLAASKFGYEWLKRNKVEQKRNDVDTAELSSRESLIKGYDVIFAGLIKQIEEANRHKDAAEKRAEDIFQQSRKDRAEYLVQGRKERAADRAEIEKLSGEIHALTLKVQTLSSENESLTAQVKQMATLIGGRRQTDA